MTWAAYIQKRGSLNPGMRVEEEISKLRAMIYNIMKKPEAPSRSFKDFMTHVDQEPITLENAMQTWS